MGVFLKIKNHIYTNQSNMSNELHLKVILLLNYKITILVMWIIRIVDVKVKKDVLFEMSITKVLEKIKILIKIFSYDYMSKIIKIIHY